MIFRRKLYSKMLEWKNDEHGTTALLIKGPRRVGKSTLVEEFAKNEYASYILVDFAKAKKEVLTLFDDISDLGFIFMRLQMIYRSTLIERKSVIIFDEVQKAPNARQAIKYLVQDGRYDYIETGSLLSIKKNVENIIIPSEELQICLNPLDYEEFRWALGDEATIPLLRSAFEKRIPMGEEGNRNLMRDFRLYMLVGGMPQAVKAYIETHNMAKVDKVKRNILAVYEGDFRKIDSTGNASRLFRAIPAELTRNSSRYQVSSVIETARSRTVAQTVANMEDSMAINMAYHSNDPNVGMALHKDINLYKMYLCDTGLFVTLAFLDKGFTDNVIYEKLLNDKLGADLGYVYENMMAQTLRASGNELYYYTFPTEKGNHNYEIDFLISERDKISPIEVKSSGYKVHVSLDAFCQKFSSRILHKYLVYTKDLKKDKDILCIPMYMAGCI